MVWPGGFVSDCQFARSDHVAGTSIWAVLARTRGRGGGMGVWGYGGGVKTTESNFESSFVVDRFDAAD